MAYDDDDYDDCDDYDDYDEFFFDSHFSLFFIDAVLPTKIFNSMSSNSILNFNFKKHY